MTLKEYRQTLKRFKDFIKVMGDHFINDKWNEISNDKELPLTVKAAFMNEYLNCKYCMEDYKAKKAGV